MPPALISTASNPSIPSASSSTVGSPYSGPVNMVAQDEYNTAMSHGLGVFPTIVGQDGFDFANSGFETELPIGHEKLNGNFVGECADLSSSQKRSSTFPIAICQPTPTASPSAHPLSASPDHLTVDTFDDAYHVPALVSARRVSSFEASLVSQSEPLFKSPTTPASAYPRTPGTNSPVDRRLPVHGGQQSAAPQQQHVPAVAQQPHPMQQYPGQFQNHFFAQSSGSFMPPLELSCPFSFPPACISFSSYFISLFTTFLDKQNADIFLLQILH